MKKEINKFFSRAVSVYRRKGASGFIKAAFRQVYGIVVTVPRDRIAALIRRRFDRRTFSFRGEKYFYLTHAYNRTWTNERFVEVPIALGFVHNASGSILEVGDVLNNYFPFPHDIVDKYGSAARVINEDVVDYTPSRRYDLIISVSTIEHVGWDEAVREPNKTLRAVEKMKQCLAPGGTMVITVPVGYNPHLDELLKGHAFPFHEIVYLKRISGDNEWKEVPEGEALGMKYGAPFHAANAIAVGIVSG